MKWALMTAARGLRSSWPTVDAISPRADSLSLRMQGGMGGVELGRPLGHQVGGVALAADEDLDRAADGQGQKQADPRMMKGAALGKPPASGVRAEATSHQFVEPRETGALGRRAARVARCGCWPGRACPRTGFG